MYASYGCVVVRDCTRSSGKLKQTLRFSFADAFCFHPRAAAFLIDNCKTYRIAIITLCAREAAAQLHVHFDNVYLLRAWYNQIPLPPPAPRRNGGKNGAFHATEFIELVEARGVGAWAWFPSKRFRFVPSIHTKKKKNGCARRIRFTDEFRIRQQHCSCARARVCVCVSVPTCVHIFNWHIYTSA